MKKSIMLALGLVATLGVFAQDRYFTKTGKVSFFSKATLENIEAHNRSVTAVLDTKSGALQFSVPVKGFEFDKALMQEHFNENYMESTKFPKAEFKGQIVNNGDVDYTKEGSYNVKVKGKLTVHGETKDVETDGKVTIKGGKVQAESDFNVALADYKIKNDKLQNISNTIRVSVNCTLEPLK
ncbi:MAG TPA: YceI family protein [Chitinophagaceae bacterium]|nr:YceI family protein [Chitinophagaceae bacterium]